MIRKNSFQTRHLNNEQFFANGPRGYLTSESFNKHQVT